MSNQLYWADNQATPSYYEVSHSLEDVGTYTSLGTTSDTTFTHGTGDMDSWYRIRALYANGTSDWTNPFQPFINENNDHCIIYGDIRQLNMRYSLSDVEEIEAVPVHIAGQHFIWGLDLTAPSKASVNTQGYFQLVVTKNTPIRLSIPSIGLTDEFFVPSASSVNYRDLERIEDR